MELTFCVNVSVMSSELYGLYEKVGYWMYRNGIISLYVFFLYYTRERL
jgi:hypothetical protein